MFSLTFETSDAYKALHYWIHVTTC